MQKSVHEYGNPEAHVLVRRLSSLWELREAEIAALLDQLTPSNTVRRGEDIVLDGSRTSSIAVILSGVACRYRMLGDGQRQIVAFLLPGDVVDLFSAVGDVHDHGVGALTSCVVTRIPKDAFERLMACYPNLAAAIWRYCLSQCSMLQSWLSNMRRRSAAERLAHLFCEQFVRLECVGLAERGKPVDLHIVQPDLADATGMSSVHVNRTLQQLRNRGLVGRNPSLLEILDWEGLRDLADFDPTYLHLRLAPATAHVGALAQLQGTASDRQLSGQRAPAVTWSAR